METTVTFQQQATKYLSDIAEDVRPATLRSYRSILNAQLIPAIGGEELSSIGNKTAKLLVQRLVKAGMEPASIRFAVTIMKQVLASATNGDGDCLYPRQWNAKFIKAPKVENQKTPVMGLAATGETLAKAEGEIGALVALIGGTGLRIGEALSIVVGDGAGSVWDSAGSTISVESTETQCGIQNAPKTTAGRRVVDLHPDLNKALEKLGRAPGERLFRVKYRTAYRRLAELKVPGFHSLRRMRITYLQNKNVPTTTVKFWVGHAAGDITERYTKVGSEIEARKDWTERAGLGFTLEA